MIICKDQGGNTVHFSEVKSQTDIRHLAIQNKRDGCIEQVYLNKEKAIEIADALLKWAIGDVRMLFPLFEKRLSNLESLAEQAARKRFCLVGGNPFRGYTGTLTFTSLQVCGFYESEEEVKKAWKQHYSECGGLMLIIDTHAGAEAKIDFEI